MLRKILIISSVAIALMSCSNDDDVTTEDRAALDDAAIEQLLMDYYFEETRGRITAFDEDDESDDNFPSLYSMAEKDPTGFWYVKRPEVEATGPAVTDNNMDSILISYDARQFLSTNDAENPYGSLFSFGSTINGTGSPQWDPTFYYAGLNSDQVTDTNQPDFYEIEGFVEGLKKFNSTGTNGTDVFNFQGVIVVPSRLAFGREVNLVGVTNDVSFLFNFELHKIEERQEQL